MPTSVSIIKRCTLSCTVIIKPPDIQGVVKLSGERGIRTPGGVTLNSFQDCRIRPLCHFSNGVQI